MSNNPHYEAGRILTAIRKSEREAQKAANNAWKRHQARCESIMAPASEEAKRLLAVSYPSMSDDKSEPVDANDYAAANPDLSTLSPALRAPVPPADGVVVKTRGR